MVVNIQSWLHFSGLFGTLSTIAREEGAGALWKGLEPGMTHIVSSKGALKICSLRKFYEKQSRHLTFELMYSIGVNYRCAFALRILTFTWIQIFFPWILVYPASQCSLQNPSPCVLCLLLASMDGIRCSLLSLLLVAIFDT